MGWVSGIVVYIMIWWVVIFTTLPWRVQAQKNPHPGCAVEAPAHAYILAKMLITTLISAMIWIIIYKLIQARFINFDT